ncbi:MAG TPA: IS3 family transposase [Pyrinomonadaceae bacterium]|nr:IS3 family transposase [Pyrinomonadaceae bacterium]
MPGDESQCQWLLRVAETLDKTAVSEKKKLAELVRNCYFENRRRYGTRRIKKALGRKRVKTGRSKIRRLMTEENLKAIRTKAFKPKPTDSKAVAAAPNMLAQINTREYGVGKIIIGDITFACEAASSLIWQCGRIKSPDESSVGVYLWK